MNEIRKIYSIVYDNKGAGSNGLGEFLGEFQVIQQLKLDEYVDYFIGKNIDTGEICLILSSEIIGHFGGIKYEVFSLSDYVNK